MRRRARLSGRHVRRLQTAAIAFIVLCQTRGIRCLDHAVELLASASVFVVTFGPSRQPQAPISRRIVQGEHPSEFGPPESLGGSAAAFAANDLPARTLLETSDTRAHFALDMSGAPHRTGLRNQYVTPCWIDAETRLVQLDGDREARSRTLFKSIVINKCRPGEFDGESPDGQGAPLPVPECIAGAGRQARSSLAR